MIQILLRFIQEKIDTQKIGFFYYFLIPIFMLYSKSTTSQVVSEFTTISSNTGCGSFVVEFEDLSTGNPDTWLWDFGNGNTSTIQNPVMIYTNPGFYTVELTVSDSSSSDVITMIDFIKVYEKPSPNFHQNTTNFCIPLDVLFTDQSVSESNIISWMWDFGDGGSSNVQHPTYHYTDDGVYTVSLSVEDNNGCENIIIFNDLINARSVPVSSFSSDINISCDTDKIINFSNLSTGATNYNWSFGDGQISSQSTPSHNYLSGIYSVTLISDNGICADTLVENNFIEIGASLTTEFISNLSSSCKDTTVSFIDITLNNPDSWFWDFGDGTTSTLQNPIHYYDNPGLYTVNLTTSINGECISSEQRVDFIEIFPDLIIDFTADSIYSCDLPFNVQFIDNTLNASSWNWHFENGDSSNLQNPIISFNSYDSFDVQLELTDINGCSSIIISSDYISTYEMELKFDVSDSIICESDIVVFTDSSSSTFPIISYLWDFGDGTTSTLQNPQHQFNTISVFDISLYLENSIGCRRYKFSPSFIKTVGPPNADFIADPIILCAGQDVNFTDLTTSPDIVTDWLWDFGDGNTSYVQNPTYQYNILGLYGVTLIAGSGNCTDTLRINNYIEIIEPVSFFGAEFNCDEPLQVDFINLSEGADYVVWDFDDGTTSNQLNPTHIFPSRGNYQVSLTVTNAITGCTHEFIKQVRVTIPEANFTYLVNANNSFEDSVMCAPKRAHLNNLSIDCSYYKVKWEDGYTGYGRLDHLFTEVGTWDVSLIITDIHYCKDTFTINNMYRVSSVESDFERTDLSGCDSLVDFADLSSVASNVVWFFGDGDSSSLNNPQHVYSVEGIYDVTLYSTSLDGCKDTLTKEEYVKVSYSEIDIAVSDNEICRNDVVFFIDSSIGIALDYIWDFGDGVTSTTINPTHIYSSIGAFPISVVVTDTFGCSSSIIVDIVEVQEVIANFTSSLVSSDCPPLITTFINQSSFNIVNYSWDFGDGLVSSQESPSHLYLSPGNYDVQLIVEDNFACTDTLLLEGMISIFGPTGNFSFSENIICDSDSVEFIPNTQNADFYLWDFGDGTFSTDSNPTHVYNGGDYFHPILIIENSASCQLILHSQDSIEVIEIIVDAGLNDDICLGDSVFISANGNGSSYVWHNSPFILDSFNQNTVVFPDVSMMFYVTNTEGMCEGIDSIYISVSDEIPVPTFTTLYNCYKDSMLLIGNSGMSDVNFDWKWNILGENLFTQNAYFEFDTIGQYFVELTVTNLDNYCDAMVLQLVEVLELPVANFRADEVCFGEKMSFTNLSSDDVVSCVWSFDDGYQSSFNFDPTCLFSSSGIFNPTLVVASEKGCLNSISKQVVVHEIPEVEMSISTVCEDDENLFESFTVLSDGIITNWDWNYGDNSFLSDQEHTTHIYNDFGHYDVTLTVMSNFGCMNTSTGTAIVHPNPQASFLVEQMCEGDLTRFTNNSSLSEGAIFSYNWNFGDGKTSTLENPNNQFVLSGSYLITLDITSVENCLSSINKSIIIHPLPEVDFLVDTRVCEDDNIHFVDISSSDGRIINWEWNFGDYNNSNLQNPKNTYCHAGIYDVSLSVESEFFCKNSVVKEQFITVFDNPTASFDITDNKVSVLNSQIIFTNTSDKDLYFEWDFDNGETNSLDNVVTTYFDIAGFYQISLYVENEIGCFDQVTHGVEVEEEFSIFVPSAFTPNGDGLNDIFEAQANSVLFFEMRIYNRWGELVYFSQDINLGWDGTTHSSNKIIENGTYTYNIYLTDYNDKPWVYNGELSLMK